MPSGRQHASGMTTIVSSGGALTVPFAEIGDCPAHWVADWAVAASGREGLMTGMRGPRSGRLLGSRGGGIGHVAAGGVASVRRGDTAPGERRRCDLEQNDKTPLPHGCGGGVLWTRLNQVVQPEMRTLLSAPGRTRTAVGLDRPTLGNGFCSFLASPAPPPHEEKSTPSVRGGAEGK